MALAVALGAFGAHGLKERVAPDLLVIWETGARYHAYHALGLLGLAGFAAVAPERAQRRIRTIGALMVVGIVVFSGSLYLLAATGVRWLGAITPIGGTAWIVAWLMFAFTAWSARTSPGEARDGPA